MELLSLCVFIFHFRVPVAFISDRLRIRTDERWTKLLKSDVSETRIVWADSVQKMNRSDAKVIQ